MTTQLAPLAADGEAAGGAVLDRDEEALPAASVALDEILPTPAVAPAPPARPVLPGMRTARVTALAGRRATLVFRGRAEAVEAAVAPEVDGGVVADAVESGDSVLVEVAEGELPLVVGVLHTRRPSVIRLKASTIEIEGEEEVLVRSGRGALRIRADGEVEVVGSRISAASRGLFRIVGRILRLN